MTATDLTVSGGEWLQLLAGVLVWLLPGLAAVARWLQGVPRRWLWAPVFSFTLLALGAIVLDYAGQVPVRRGVSWTLAVVLAVVLAWPVMRDLAMGKRRFMMPRVAWRTFPWGLLVALGFLFVVFSLPHLPGSSADSVLEVVPALATRSLDLVTGNDAPYAVHVDEHVHMARIAQIDRTGDVDIADPYTGANPSTPLFSVSGMRSERGWQIGIAQLHHMTGASLPTLFHFLPAVWATYTGLLLWSLLRPAPGAALAPLFFAIVPTTVRFLGPAFLVPSAFALPWILAVIQLASRGHGSGRLVGLSLIVTGAFFVHLVPGTLALFAGMLTALLRPGTLGQRLGLLAALLLPMVWIFPAMLADMQAAVASTHGLPFEQHLFRRIGLVGAGLVGVGTFVAWLRPAHVTHRVLAILGSCIVGSLLWSLAANHSNDATYSRLIPTLFLCLAALMSLAASTLGQVAQNGLQRVRRGWGQAKIGAVLAGIVAVAAIAPAVQASIEEPYYRVLTDEAWLAAQTLSGIDAFDNDTFLSHPWQAPVFNAVSGIKPHAYLIPGRAPIAGADYDTYVRTRGADAEWLAERGITLIVGMGPPNAPYEVLGPGVYRVFQVGQ